jgi:hypothetical protein
MTLDHRLTRSLHPIYYNSSVLVSLIIEYVLLCVLWCVSLARNSCPPAVIQVKHLVNVSEATGQCLVLIVDVVFFISSDGLAQSRLTRNIGWFRRNLFCALKQWWIVDRERHVCHKIYHPNDSASNGNIAKEVQVANQLRPTFDGIAWVSQIQ